MSFNRRMILNKQQGQLSLAADGVTVSVTSGNITVFNSSYIRLRKLGHDWILNGGGGTAPYTRLSLNIIDAVTVTVTATRSVNSCDSSINTEYEVSDLNPILVKSIQRSTITLNASDAITAVTLAHSELDNLGTEQSSGLIGSSLLVNPDNSHIQVANNLDPASVTGWQLIEGY